MSFFVTYGRQNGLSSGVYKIFRYAKPRALGKRGLLCKGATARPRPYRAKHRLAGMFSVMRAHSASPSALSAKGSRKARAGRLYR